MVEEKSHERGDYVKVLLIIVVGLMMWGPPRLRLDERPLETALQEPFDMDPAAIFQVAVWAMGLLMVLLTMSRRGLAGRPFIPAIVWRSSLRWYLSYGALAMASAIYSASPLYTIYFAGKIFISILAVALITDRSDLTNRLPLALRIFLAVSIIQLILNAAIFAVRPELVGHELPGIGYRLSGGLLEDYGTPAAMSGAFFLWTLVYHSKRFMRALMLVLYLASWVFVLLSRTRSTIVGATVMLLLLLATHRRLSSRLMAGVGLAIAMVMMVLTQAVDPIVSFGMRGQNLDSFLSLTGRAQAFDFLSYQWAEAPWFGFGYAAGSRYLLIRFVQQTGWGIGAAHDAISKVLVELGGVGLALLTTIFVLSWIEVLAVVRLTARTGHSRPLAVQALLFLAFFSLINVVSGGVAEASFPYLLVSLTAAIVRDRVGMNVCRASKLAAHDDTAERTLAGHAA